MNTTPVKPEHRIPKLEKGYYIIRFSKDDKIILLILSNLIEEKLINNKYLKNGEFHQLYDKKGALEKFIIEKAFEIKEEK